MFLVADRFCKNNPIYRIYLIIIPPDSTPPVAVGIFLYYRIDEVHQIVKLIRLGNMLNYSGKYSDFSETIFYARNRGTLPVRVFFCVQLAFLVTHFQAICLTLVAVVPYQANTVDSGLRTIGSLCLAWHTSPISGPYIFLRQFLLVHCHLHCLLPP